MQAEVESEEVSLQIMVERLGVKLQSGLSKINQTISAGEWGPR